jgi:hypothetical protein
MRVDASFSSSEKVGASYDIFTQPAFRAFHILMDRRRAARDDVLAVKRALLVFMTTGQVVDVA